MIQRYVFVLCALALHCQGLGKVTDVQGIACVKPVLGRRWTLVEKGTALKPGYARTGFFATGVPHQITVIKKGRGLFMYIRNAEQELLCHWPNPDLPMIEEGRIGLRHMYARSARYRNVRVSVLPSDQ